MTRTPNFDELVGRDVPPPERERLRKVHELLLHADAPPELSPGLDAVPWPDEALQPLGLARRQPQRRRPWLVYATAAAALVLVGFLLGQIGGSKSASFEAVRTVKMHGVGNVSEAAAVIEIGRVGSDGNWPMVMNVTKLPPTHNGYYDLWLSKRGKPVYLCGTFNTRVDADTVVRLSAAYSFKKGDVDGWIVTQHVRGKPKRQSHLVLTT